MRADRLVAAIFVLQARGHVTAAELARELEVSERTARRDLESLALAGVPVYSQRGRNGGWSLVGGARTDLTGLTAQETRALFLAAGPVAAATPDLRSALRKLMQAVPAPLRRDAEAASGAVFIDDLDWTRDPLSDSDGHRDALVRAIVDELQVCLGYAAPGRPSTKGTVDPLGLVSKAGAWYLVAQTDRGLRAFRVSRVTSVQFNGEPVRRPADFDLTMAWRSLAAPIEELMAAAAVKVREECGELAGLRRLIGSGLPAGEPAPDGKADFPVDGAGMDLLTAHLAAIG
ncbi:WYL domain-containing protein [Streptomyces sp. NBC_01476]|uniref:helix-turn-helix transcriptional regulator n=1 Tax=Streptomyces sp. NBC_01476 TaxID=2903881 RepID=UPI002E35C170|nr:WYL domain-containing protein [Streptomyces sp. NBC_01476]